MGGADHDDSRGTVRLAQPGVTDAIPGGIDFSDIGEVHGLVGIGGLIPAQGDQSLAPVGVAVAEQLPGVGGL